MQEKNARGKTPARQPNMSRSGDPHLQTFTERRRARACPSPTLTRAGDKPCRWRSPDRQRDRIRHSCPTVVREHPLPNRSRSGDLDLRTIEGDRRRQTPCSWRSPERHSAGSGDPALQRETHAGEKPPRSPYFACFTSPNVFNARCAGDTGPRNRRVTNVSGLPPNETSSI